MEKELFLSGYCRTTDNSRIVEVIVENGEVTEVDCCYENCPHTANCLVVKSIQELSEN